MDSSLVKTSVLPDSGIRILSIDAGGVRCFCPLKLLHKISKIIRDQTSRPKFDSNGELPKPCQYFDLICGSEYGGILAIMLGRLQMSVEECSDWFRRNTHKLDVPYSTYQMLKTTPIFSSRYERSRSQSLKALFLSLLAERHLSESEQLYGCVDDDPVCKTMVLVTDQVSGSAVRLRSYASKSDGGASIGSLSIVDAALAAVAGPTSSAPVELREKMLISAYYAGYSNPSKEAFDEATRVWSVNSVKIVVSLGTGTLERDFKLKGGVWAILDLTSNILHDSDRVDQELYRDSRIVNFDCYRFKGPALFVSKIGRNEWHKVRTADEMTKAYHRRADVKSSLVACAQSLVSLSTLDYQYLAVPVEDSLADESDNSEFVPSESCPAALPSPPKSAEGSGTCPTSSPDIHLAASEVVSLQDSNIESIKVSGTILANTGSRRSQGVGSDSDSTHSDISQESKRSLLFDSMGAMPNVRGDSSADVFVKQHKRAMCKIISKSSLEYAPKVKIAILDTGIDSSHPFIQKYWKKVNGTVHEDYPWIDFVAENRNTEPKIHDKDGHGTHLAGIVLQLAPFVELYVARVFETGQMDKGAPERVAKAIRHAVDSWNINIISMSFGFQDFWPEIDAAIDYAFGKDVVLLAAASNNGLRPPSPVAWPARKLGQVFCINSATPFGKDSDFNPPLAADNRDNFSAIGENIRSTWPRSIQANGVEQDKHGTWKRQSGTSVATPIAAAVAACVMQFGILNAVKIGQHAGKLQEYRGIRQIFLHMAGDRNRYRSSDGFAFISPEKLFDLRKWSCEDTISGELEKELQKLL